MTCKVVVKNDTVYAIKTNDVINYIKRYLKENPNANPSTGLVLAFIKLQGQEKMTKEYFQNNHKLTSANKMTRFYFDMNFPPK